MHFTIDHTQWQEHSESDFLHTLHQSPLASPSLSHRNGNGKGRKEILRRKIKKCTKHIPTSTEQMLNNVQQSFVIDDLPCQDKKQQNRRALEK